MINCFPLRADRASKLNYLFEVTDASQDRVLATGAMARGLVFGHLDQLKALICYLYQYFAFNLSLALSLLSSIIYLNMSAGMEYIFIIRL